MLGRVTVGGVLVLGPGVGRFAVDLDTRWATVWCSACGTEREFRGAGVMGAQTPG